MGAWDAGNFDNDAALDMVERALEVTTTEIEAFCQSGRSRVEELDTIVACVAIHLALHEHCHASAPDGALATTIRRKALALYDEQIDSLEPEPSYKVARRGVLVDTLAAYERAGTRA